MVKSVVVVLFFFKWTSVIVSLHLSNIPLSVISCLNLHELALFANLYIFFSMLTNSLIFSGHLIRFFPWTFSTLHS